MSELRYWYVQKPREHNRPLEENTAVFQDFKPTISRHGCEWVKVVSVMDLQKSAGKNLTHYIELSKSNLKLEKELQTTKQALEVLTECTHDPFKGPLILQECAGCENKEKIAEVLGEKV